MHVILNGEPLEEVDCFKYLGSQVAADGGCERDVVHRMNELLLAWGALKNVLSNKDIGFRPRSIYMKEYLCQRIVRSRGMGYEKC